jgi:hypothetical protein
MFLTEYQVTERISKAAKNNFFRKRQKEAFGISFLIFKVELKN